MKIKIFTLVVFLLLFLGGFSAVFGYIAVDPTRTIPNARVLGLGKAYNALANDCGSLYTNPSGMADAENWQMTSMSGTFLDEFNFLSFSGIYPTDYGSFGIGYAGTSISGAWATTLEAGTNLDDPIYTIDQNQDPMSYQNSAYILSYANQLKEVNFLKQYPLVENVVNNLSVGGNIKIFNVRLAGDGIQNGNAAGTEVDLGAKYYPPQKWMKFGLTFQNLLPMSMGGKLTYASGHTESYPLVVEGGSVFNILGKDDSLYEYGEHDIKMMLDFDMHPTLSGYPMAWHLATEWFPIPMVAIRAGLDQDAGDDGNGNLIIYSDMAYGVGLRVGGFNFDYAYHTFAGAPNINNSYFSMSYGLIPKPKAPEEPIIVGNPEDKLITFANKVDVIGAVVEPDIRYLTLNGVPLKFSLRGDFKADVDLRVGRNPIVLEGKDKEGKTIRLRKLRILRLSVFPDVPQTYWVARPISLLAMQKIITGYPDGTFRPEGDITRAEMCTLLMKTRVMDVGSMEEEALFEQLPPEFNDVPERHWAAQYIAQAAQEGIVKGYPDGTFQPKKSITRAEGLAMVARFAGISEEAYLGEFPDVSAKHWAAKVIAGAHSAGILDYLSGQAFQLNKRLTRAETVEMLSRTKFVAGVLDKNLLDWGSY